MSNHDRYDMEKCMEHCCPPDNCRHLHVEKTQHVADVPDPEGHIPGVIGEEQLDMLSGQSVTQLGQRLTVARDYPLEGELAQRIHDVINEYADDLSLVAVVGILHIVANQRQVATEDGPDA